MVSLSFAGLGSDFCKFDLRDWGSCADFAGTIVTQNDMTKKLMTNFIIAPLLS
jgi:hypothetical protein